VLFVPSARTHEVWYKCYSTDWNKALRRTEGEQMEQSGPSKTFPFFVAITVTVVVSFVTSSVGCWFTTRICVPHLACCPKNQIGLSIDPQSIVLLWHRRHHTHRFQYQWYWNNII